MGFNIRVLPQALVLVTKCDVGHHHAQVSSVAIRREQQIGAIQVLEQMPAGNRTQKLASSIREMKASGKGGQVTIRRRSRNLRNKMSL